MRCKHIKSDPSTCRGRAEKRDDRNEENSGKAWTRVEDGRLRELAASGAVLIEIAEKLNRTVSATKTRAYILRVMLGRLELSAVRCLSRWR